MYGIFWNSILPNTIKYCMASADYNGQSYFVKMATSEDYVGNLPKPKLKLNVLHSKGKTFNFTVADNYS